MSYKTSAYFILTRYHVCTQTVIFKQCLTSFAKFCITLFMDILFRSKNITILWALVCNNMDVMCSKTGWKGIFGLRLWFFDKLTVDGVGGCLTIGTQLKILALLMKKINYWVYSYLWKMLHYGLRCVYSQYIVNESKELIRIPILWILIYHNSWKWVTSGYTVVESKTTFFLVPM